MPKPLHLECFTLSMSSPQRKYHLYSHQGNNNYQKLVVRTIWEQGCRDDSKVIQFRPKNKFIKIFIVGASTTMLWSSSGHINSEEFIYFFGIMNTGQPTESMRAIKINNKSCDMKRRCSIFRQHQCASVCNRYMLSGSICCSGLQFQDNHDVISVPGSPPSIVLQWE